MFNVTFASDSVNAICYYQRAYNRKWRSDEIAQELMLRSAPVSRRFSVNGKHFENGAFRKR